MKDKEVFREGIPNGNITRGTEARDPQPAATPSNIPDLPKQQYSAAEQTFYDAIKPLTREAVMLENSNIRMVGTFTVDQLHAVASAFERYLNAQPQP